MTREDLLTQFQRMKARSEARWLSIEPNPTVYGFQVQPGTIWNPGLTADKIISFEKEMEFEFPEEMNAFYSTMNGLNKDGVNLYGNSGYPIAYAPLYYAYPQHLDIIRNRISETCEAFGLSPENLLKNGFSRIMPIYGHRFVLIDIPENPILSMVDRDVIPWANSITECLEIEIFGDSLSVNIAKGFPKIPGWLNGV